MLISSVASIPKILWTSVVASAIRTYMHEHITHFIEISAIWHNFVLNVSGVKVQLSRNWKASYDWLITSERKWSLRSADVRGEERSLRTSAWEARGWQVWCRVLPFKFSMLMYTFCYITIIARICCQNWDKTYCYYLRHRFRATSVNTSLKKACIDMVSQR